MPVPTAWQALSGRPWPFLTSWWPWRSLVYLLCGAASGTVLVAVIGLNAPVLALPLVLVALAVSRPVARFERWRLRLIEDGAPARHRPGQRPAVEFGYGAACVAGLWLVDLGVVVASLAAPVGMIWWWLAFHGTENWRTDPNTLRPIIGILLLPLAAYPIVAWASARAALTRTILLPREAELDCQLVEVTRSRARLVDAFEIERRRIERDLHDGAQQRLVALTMALGLARLDLPADSPAASRVATAYEHAEQALTELRELIRGVHPHVLSDRGLPAAITDAASRSTIPVDLDVPMSERLPDGIEVAAYYAVCEALANIAKHSRASRARVDVRMLPGHPATEHAGVCLLVIEVRDNGVGGADPAAGTGLTGVADRIAVLDGKLLLSSPPGGPTLLRLEIPCPTTVHSG